MLENPAFLQLRWNSQSLKIEENFVTADGQAADGECIHTDITDEGCYRLAMQQLIDITCHHTGNEVVDE